MGTRADIETLNEREKRVLELILHSYIATAEPVGSRTLARALNNRWSSATIRNIMADLEEQGFLFKAHVVAGRIPTGRAFRYYVNSLLIPKGPGKRELQALENLTRQRHPHVAGLMEDASRMLADLCKYTSIVVEPKVNTMLFKEIEFVKLSKNTVLVVFVTSSGMVHTRLVTTEEELDLDFLHGMKAYMNEKCEGLPFYSLKREIFEDLRRDREAFRMLMAKVVEALEGIMEGEGDREVYLEGASKMIGVPEFSDVSRLKELFQAFEKKEKLLRLLEKSLEEGGIHVIIGAESDLREMRHMSIITSTYKIDNSTNGVLGVIGPIRMNYSKIIPIVNGTAKAITEVLSGM
jgi:heat-inducible transcriptional repressor